MTDKEIEMLKNFTTTDLSRAYQDLEAKTLSLFKVSGMTIDEIISRFLKGYILTPSDKQAEKKAIKEFAERFNNIVDEELEKYSLKDFEEFKAICQVLRGLKIRYSYSVKEMVGEDK